MGVFTGRSVFITGGSRGIGRGIAKRLADDGAKVAIIDVNEEALQEAKAYFLENNQEILAIAADVTDRAQVEAAMKEAHDAFGSIDVLVNNAGVIRDNMLFKNGRY